MRRGQGSRVLRASIGLRPGGVGSWHSMVAAPRGATPRRALTPAPPVPLTARPGAYQGGGKTRGTPRRTLPPAAPNRVWALESADIACPGASKGGGGGGTWCTACRVAPVLCAADPPLHLPVPAAVGPPSVGGGRGRRAQVPPPPSWLWVWVRVGQQPWSSPGAFLEFSSVPTSSPGEMGSLNFGVQV